MSIPSAFKYNQDVKYRTGGVYEPTHRFSLVNQTIRVNKRDSFMVRFPNIWMNYKLPKITDPKIYDDWLDNQMQFWQNQLNFAIWCATTGSGVSKQDHLAASVDPMIRSLFRFHVYFQIRRILFEMSCPLPSDESFNALDNGIDQNAFERICSEFGISVNDNFRQKFDLSNGMGSYWFNKKFYDWKLVTTRKWSVLTNGGGYHKDLNWRVKLRGHPFGGQDEQTDPILYIEQAFDVDPDITDKSIKKGDSMAAIGSFVTDTSFGFTQAGISRINDSIRAYVWAILGAQSQTRSTILGSGKAFDAQKQFLANVEDAINSEVDIPSSIERYQTTLRYARSKVDYVVGIGLYMIPSNMDLFIGTINGYNNLIVIVEDDLKLGQNVEVNESVAPLTTLLNDDFSSNIGSVAPRTAPLSDNFSVDNNENEFDDQVDESNVPKVEDTPLTHDENKLLFTLGGVVAGTTLIWFMK